MKIVVFGGSGQVGSEVRLRAASRNIQVFAPTSTEVDIADGDNVASYLDGQSPDAIINCAAYTAVDKAEIETTNAYRINVTGSKNIAAAAAKHGCRLIHVSTDYVFDGTLGRPIREDDPTNPLSVYGKTKREGEIAVAEETDGSALIVRTSAVYGNEGVNFVSTILRLLRERDSLSIVSDQWMSPTWAGWLGATLLDLLRYNSSGILHAACSGSTTWFDFATAIRDLSGVHTQSQKLGELIPITAAEYGAPAPRPLFSVLDCTKIQELFQTSLLPWRDGLSAYLEGIGYGQRTVGDEHANDSSYRSINRFK